MPLNQYTHININIINIGINTISTEAIKPKIILDCNSTKDIKSRAPHHEFCPSVWNNSHKYFLNICMLLLHPLKRRKFDGESREQLAIYLIRYQLLPYNNTTVPQIVFEENLIVSIVNQYLEGGNASKQKWISVRFLKNGDKRDWFNTLRATENTEKDDLIFPKNHLLKNFLFYFILSPKEMQFCYDYVGHKKITSVDITV